MSRPMELLPQILLDEIVTATLLLTPSLRGAFLSSLGKRLHSSAVRVLFQTVSLPDDSCTFAESASNRCTMLYPVLSNPTRYASNVKTLIIANPPIPEDGVLLHDSMLHPIDTDDLVCLFEICSNLEALVWESPFPPPDGLCEILATHNPSLLRVDFAPLPLPSCCSLVKWNAPSLPLLSSAPLTSLHVSRLSQAGARVFCFFLENLGDESLLECLNIDFVWLDDLLCQKIVCAGKKLQKLILTTNGTKLSDRGLVTILEGCDALEDFVLDEVQGRLSRFLWTKPVCFPAALKSLRIVISETGPHHSWATDHLESLHAIPLDSMSSLNIVRREAPPSLHCGVAIYDGLVDDVVALKPIPPSFMDRIKQQKSQIISFRCDFWSFSIADIKLLLENSPKLEHTQLSVDAPFAKLIGLTSNFASLSSLRTLSVSITPAHAPGNPPIPVLPVSDSGSSTSLPTPTESPVLKSKSVLPQLLNLDQMQNQPCHSETPVDPSMPLLRDIKRFVRKCPRLEVIDWYGKSGRGSWVISRPGTSSKSTNVLVEYNAPMITEKVWNALKREKSIEEAVKRGWGDFSEIERAGCVWAGEKAEALAADWVAEEKEEAATSPAERGKTRATAKRVRVPSVSISSSSGSDVLPLTPTTSPIQHTPLTPPLSDSSILELDAISPSETTYSSRKWSPSEPNAGNGGLYKARARSATVNSKESTDGDDLSPIASGTGFRGVKYARGRGAARGTARSTGNSATSSGRGRGGRGSKTSVSETTRLRRSAATG